MSATNQCERCSGRYAPSTNDPGLRCPGCDRVGAGAGRGWVAPRRRGTTACSGCDERFVNGVLIDGYCPDCHQTPAPAPSPSPVGVLTLFSDSWADMLVEAGRESDA